MKSSYGLTLRFLGLILSLSVFQTTIIVILLKAFPQVTFIVWVLSLSLFSLLWIVLFKYLLKYCKKPDKLNNLPLNPPVHNIDKLEKFRKEYVANISHELKTPVFNIQGYLESLLSTGIFEPVQARSFLEKALKNAYRLETIIKDLELLSQSDSGNLSLTTDDFDLGGLINEVLEETEIQAAKNKIQMESHIPPGRFSVHADRHRIKQVLLNLVSNAIRYNRKNGKVYISCRTDGSKVIVMIKDTGMGIKSKHLPRIFERFYRVDKARSRKKGGSGLGLAIVKHIMEAHNEQVFVKSTPCEGSEFYITLPQATR